MSRRSNRPRRLVTQRQLKVLRLLGWRYSITREAYVHRIGGGAIGPVFRSLDDARIDGVVDTHLFEAMKARRVPRVLPPEQRPPLPRRAKGEVDVDLTTDASAAPADDRTTSGERPVIPVEVSLRTDEPPRVVHVDGRPPTRGVDPNRVRRGDGVVVPIRTAASA